MREKPPLPIWEEAVFCACGGESYPDGVGEAEKARPCGEDGVGEGLCPLLRQRRRGVHFIAERSEAIAAQKQERIAFETMSTAFPRSRGRTQRQSSAYSAREVLKPSVSSGVFGDFLRQRRKSPAPAGAEQTPQKKGESASPLDAKTPGTFTVPGVCFRLLLSLDRQPRRRRAAIYQVLK